MQSLKLIFTSLLCLVLFSQCKSPFSSDEEKTTETKTKIKDDNAANEIIAFNNKFISYTENQAGLLRGLPSYFSQANAVTTSDNPYSMTPIKPLYIESVMYKAKEVPDAFGKEQADMQKSYVAMNENFDAIKTLLDEVDKYLQAEDYKDDGGAKLKEWEEKAKAHADEYYKNSDIVYAKLNAAADKAEEVILKNHPLKEYIISSKKVLTLSESILDELSAQLNAGQYNADKMQAAYNKLEEAYNKNSSMKYKASEEYKNKEQRWNRLNSDTDAYLGALRKIMRDAKENGGNVDDAVARNLETSYKMVLNAYNNFVD